MLWINILITCVLAVTQEPVVEYNYDQKTVIEMNQDEWWWYEPLNSFGNIMSYQVKHQYEGEIPQCDVYLQSVEITPIETSIQLNQTSLLDIDDLTALDLYDDNQNKFAAMVKYPHGLVLLTNQGQLYIVGIKQRNSHFTAKLLYMLDATSEENGNQGDQLQLRYVDSQKVFYKISSNRIVRFKVQDDQIVEYTTLLGWQPLTGKFKVVFDQNGQYLICTHGQQGLFIYEIKGDELQLDQIIGTNELYGKSRPIDIVDVEIQGNKLYVLDKISGISQLIYDNHRYVYVLNKELGLILINDATSFTVQDEIMIIIVQLQTYSSVIELYINENEWTQMRRFDTSKHQLSSSVISKDIAIIRGQHTGFYYFTQLNQMYVNEAQITPEFSYAQSVDYLFYHVESDYGITVELNQHNLQLYLYEIYESAMICDVSQFVGVYYFQLQFYSTNCESKLIYDPLLVCEVTQDYQLRVYGPNLDPDQQDMILFIAIGLAALFCAVAFCIIVLYSSYRRQKEIIDRQEKIIKQKGIQSTRVVVSEQ